MKELTIEQKAKAYDEALKILHKYDGANIMFTQDLKEEMFPELKENEDEKDECMLNNIIDTLRALSETTHSGYAINSMIAWLKKHCNIDKASYYIVEKAKAYDEAIVHAKLLLKTIGNATLGNLVLKNEFKTMFPALEESEDERIRKTLIKYFRNCVSLEGINGEDISNWLEKQGEQKPDKIEPKFKIGDWCIDNEDGTIFQIVKVLDNTYAYKTNEGKEYSCAHYSLENDARLWTIQDAKDGDVLSDGTTIFIFKDLLSDGSVMSYCDYDTDSGESDAFCPLSVNLICSKITPATKEQRELLFQKLTEAGYEWDANKLEPKKIDMQELVKQNPAWSEEDEAIYYGVIETEQYMLDVVDGIKKFDVGNISIKEECVEELNWLRTLKDRVQPKQEWSEEDKEYLAACIDVIDNFYTLSGELKTLTKINVFSREYAEKLKSWLKSLKERCNWKPTTEQLRELRYVISGCSFETSILVELEDNLKKLL